MAAQDKADVEFIERSQERRARMWASYHQLREELAVYRADVKAGRFRTISHEKSEPLPWDGVRNSQIAPLRG